MLNGMNSMAYMNQTPGSSDSTPTPSGCLWVPNNLTQDIVPNGRNGWYMVVLKCLKPMCSSKMWRKNRSVYHQSIGRSHSEFGAIGAIRLSPRSPNFCLGQRLGSVSDREIAGEYELNYVEFVVEFWYINCAMFVSWPFLFCHDFASLAEAWFRFNAPSPFDLTRTDID